MPLVDLEAVLDGVDEGQRNDAIFRLACSDRGRGVPREEAEQRALEVARKCRPPFPDDEALLTVDSAYRRYRPNSERPRSVSSARTDILERLDVFGDPTAYPRQPSKVAALMGKGRGSVKKVMAAMCQDGQILRVPGGYLKPDLGAG